jgi:hypothetical protein
MRIVLIGIGIAFVLAEGIACSDEDPEMEAGVCPECSLLRDECTPVGMCTYEGTMFQGPGSRDCWDDGVVQSHDAATGVTTVTRNGEPCHSWESNGFMTTFYTPEGEVAGMMTFNLATLGVTIECDDKTYDITADDECPSWYPMGVDCVMGSCPAP